MSADSPVEQEIPVDKEHRVKIVLLGAPATGAKSSLAVQYVNGVAETRSSAPTCFTKMVRFGGEAFRLEIWGLYMFCITLSVTAQRLIHIFVSKQILLDQVNTVRCS